MKPSQLRLLQALADLVIPLAGYFWWNWNFYFILLFFVLDYLVSSVFTFVKVRKIHAYRGVEAGFPTGKALLSLLLIAAGIGVVFPALRLIDPGFDAAKETWAFLAYKELGIAQGIILLPLMAYVGYMQYKTQFLMNGKFAVMQVSEVWKIHFTTILLVLAASGFFLGISLFAVFPEIAYVITLSVGVVVYRFAYSR